MSFFISDALAQQGGAQSGTDFSFFIMIGIFFLIMYFMIIRPQSKRAKEHKQLIESLSKGDEVVTNGGLLGKITEVGESFIQVEVSQGVAVKVQKNAVATVMPKGTFGKSE
jgi:preprotein translocase subunit YajC